MIVKECHVAAAFTTARIDTQPHNALQLSNEQCLEVHEAGERVSRQICDGVVRHLAAELMIKGSAMFAVVIEQVHKRC